MRLAVDYQKIYDSVTHITSLFGLEAQGKSLVSMVSRLLKSPGVCLFFLTPTGDRYTVLSCKPAPKSNPLAGISLDIAAPSLARLLENKDIIRTDDLSAVELLNVFDLTSSHIRVLDKTELIAPLISSDRLAGFLLIQQRELESYSDDEVSLLEGIISRISTAMEKEYLSEQLKERERELIILNSCSRIITSSLDITDVFDEFNGHLMQLVDIDWSSILLLDNDNMYVMAIHSDIGTTWQPGEIMPVKGTSTEWVTASRMPLVESDLRNDSLFVTDVYYRKQGLRSIACLPLMVNREESIGSLVIGSRKPDAYNPKQVEFLNKLASQIAMPVQNATLYAEVLKRSRYDELTGLLNRRTMDEQIISEINRHSRYGGVFSLVLLDLDSMKYINDHYGHLAGDGLLSRTGSVLFDAIRSVDQAFRYGGDEFAILLPNTPGDSAIKVSERIRKQIASKLVVDDMTVTASFGLASWPDNGPEAVDLVAAADTALYKAKNEGGNRSYTSDNL
ncbi:MAG: diguanylate cyclase [Dehalococcoidales bacterium]|nr:diguanylate cyclase [Dehalococcoidales bacterium]